MLLYLLPKCNDNFIIDGLDYLPQRRARTLFVSGILIKGNLFLIADSLTVIKLT